LAKVDGICTVFSFGYGTDHDEKLLRAIADNGDGMYYFLEKKDDVPEAFADSLGGLLSVVGQNVRMKIIGLNGIKLDKVWTKYPQTAEEDGSVIVSLADLYGEEKRDIVCRITLPQLDSPVENENLVSFTVDYFNVLLSQMVTQSEVASVGRPGCCPPQEANFSIDKERNRLITAEAMLEARRLADSGNMDAAKILLKSTVLTLTHSISVGDSQTKEFIDDLEEAHQDMVNRQTYLSAGAKKMAWKEQKMAKQRAAGKSAAMDTPTKMRMKAAYHAQHDDDEDDE